MSNIDDFYRKECEKIDSNCIDAYTDYRLDEESPTTLCVETSWGGGCLDLTPIVKAAETVTSLELSPSDGPNCLKFNREDGGADCIHGDDLSRIISLSLLKDVDQNTPPKNGDVLMYKDGKWYTFDLQTALDNINNEIAMLKGEVTRLTNLLNQILQYWQVPEGLPNDAKIVLGNINLYSDTNAAINDDGTVSTLNKNNGLYGHDLTTDKAQDEIFG